MEQLNPPRPWVLDVPGDDRVRRLATAYRNTLRSKKATEVQLLRAERELRQAQKARAEAWFVEHHLMLLAVEAELREAEAETAASPSHERGHRLPEGSVTAA